MVNCPDTLDVFQQHAQVYNMIHQLFIISYEQGEEIECEMARQEATQRENAQNQTDIQLDRDNSFSVDGSQFS